MIARDTTLTQDRNAAVMRKIHDALNKNDLETLDELLAPGFVWHIPGRSPVAGDHKGFVGLAQTISLLMELSEGTLRVKLHDTVSSPDHGVNLDQMTAARAGKKLDMPLAFVAHIENGRITEAWDMPLDTGAWDDFWS
ncbi:MAG TPA: nuclear transport factor 2 family protein [Dehalococcoidia bacterium]|nr:nuclear transport factor 2 family protein [Dehalococcoidia bacterium]